MKTIQNIVIFDIDGTLANGEHRQHLVREKPKNWPRYFDLMEQDTVHEHTASVLAAMDSSGYLVYLLSGRPETYREHTERWLKKNDLDGMYVDLYMRAAKDSRSDDIIKEELFNKHFGDKKDAVLCVFDDRPRVIRMWRKIGIPVFNCGDGTEF